jgi:prevent-host-death family protein
MYMIRVKTAQLRAKLGYYLSLIKQGETIEVTSHALPVARIVPPDTETEAIIPPSQQISTLKSIRGIIPLRPVDGVGELLKDRNRR